MAQTKINDLEKEVSELKENLEVTDKKRKKLTQEKNEFEDREYNLTNRLKQTEVRFNAM